MKKHIYMAIGASALLFGACSNDEDLTPAGDSRTVTITVNAPESLTRSNGFAATNLQYAIYDIQKDGTMVQVGDDPIEVAVERYPLELKPLDVVTGHTYGLLFWASAPNNPYTIDWSEGTMTVIYGENTPPANTINLDAFYAYETFTVNGNENLSVTMERPFAMINIGSSEAPATDAKSSITVTNVPSSINLFTGELSEETGTVSFTSAAIPTGMTYPVDGYDYYLAFAYVLAPKTASTDNSITYKYEVSSTESKSATVNNVTLQANYQTNIYGSLP